MCGVGRACVFHRGMMSVLLLLLLLFPLMILNPQILFAYPRSATVLCDVGRRVKRPVTAVTHTLSLCHTSTVVLHSIESRLWSL